MSHPMRRWKPRPQPIEPIDLADVQAPVPVCPNIGESLDPQDRQALADWYAHHGGTAPYDVTRKRLFPVLALAPLGALLVLRLGMPLVLGGLSKLGGFIQGVPLTVLSWTIALACFAFVTGLLANVGEDALAPAKTPAARRSLRVSLLLAVVLWAVPNSACALLVFCGALLYFASLVPFVLAHARGWEKANVSVYTRTLADDPFDRLWALPPLRNLLLAPFFPKVPHDVPGTTTVERRERERFDRAPFVLYGALGLALVVFAISPTAVLGGILAVTAVVVGLGAFALFEIRSYAREHGMDRAKVLDRLRASWSAYAGYALYEAPLLGYWDSPEPWHERQRRAASCYVVLAASTMLLAAYFPFPGSFVLPDWFGFFELVRRERVPGIPLENSPEGWIQATLAGLAVAPHFWSSLLFGVACAVLTSLVVPPLFCRAALLAFGGRALLHIAHRWDQELDEHERHVERVGEEEHTEWAETLRRLRQPSADGPSPFALDFLLGKRHDTGEVYTVSPRTFRGHAHVSGATEAWKTSGLLAPLCPQVLDQPDRPNLVVFDLKSDRSFFHGVREEARVRAIDFRWFSADPTHSSHVFNPYMQDTAELPKLTRVAQLAKALRLEHGPGYGKEFFAGQSKDVLARIFHAAAVRGVLLRSFSDIAAFIEANARNVAEKVGDNALFRSEKQRDNALALLVKLQELASLPALNIYPGCSWPGLTAARIEAASRSAINLADFARYRGVQYWNLPEGLSTGLSREICQLALFGLLTALQLTPPSRRRPTYVIIDEFQALASSHLDVLFAQARAAGVRLICANQNRAQLDEVSPTFARNIQANTRLQVVFTAFDQDSRRELIESSGEVWTSEYTVSANGVTERISPKPRFTVNDIAKVSATPGVAFVTQRIDDGAAQFGGLPVAIKTLHHVPLAVHERREHTQWPPFEDEAGLLPPALQLGESGERTRFAPRRPTITPEEADRQVDHQFNDEVLDR